LLGRLRNPMVPLLLLIILLGLYFTRWEIETKTQPGPIQFVYKTDRWTGQRWTIEYKGAAVNEAPVIDTKIILSRVGVGEERTATDAKEKISKELWFKRKIMSWLWDGLLAISIVWLLYTIIKIKKVETIEHP
jgi:hypothetical protein